MKALCSSATVGFLVLAVFTLCSIVTPSPAQAKWHDNSPSDDTNVTPYIIAGAIVVTAVVVYIVIKHSRSNDDNDEVGKVMLAPEGASISVFCSSSGIPQHNILPALRRAGVGFQNPYFNAGDDGTGDRRDGKASAFGVLLPNI